MSLTNRFGRAIKA